jgi:hypothetical protein
MLVDVRRVICGGASLTRHHLRGGFEKNLRLAKITLVHRLFKKLLELRQLIGAMRDRDLSEFIGAP